MQRRARENLEYGSVPGASRQQRRREGVSDNKTSNKKLTPIQKLLGNCLCCVSTVILVVTVFTIWYHFSRSYELIYESRSTTQVSYLKVTEVLEETAAMKRLLSGCLFVDVEEAIARERENTQINEDYDTIVSSLPVFGEYVSSFRKDRSEMIEIDNEFMDHLSTVYTAENAYFTAVFDIHAYKFPEYSQVDVRATYTGHGNPERAAIRFLSFILKTQIDTLAENIVMVAQYRQNSN